MKLKVKMYLETDIELPYYFKYDLSKSIAFGKIGIDERVYIVNVGKYSNHFDYELSVEDYKDPSSSYFIEENRSTEQEYLGALNGLKNYLSNF